jgi:hypothetical protein
VHAAGRLTHVGNAGARRTRRVRLGRSVRWRTDVLLPLIYKESPSWARRSRCRLARGVTGQLLQPCISFL